jgi:hypothetical protein
MDLRYIERRGNFVHYDKEYAVVLLNISKYSIN